jgi:Glycosyl transferases group 1
MNLFVLSELHPQNTHIGWSVSYGLEEVLATACGAVRLYPIASDQGVLLKQYRAVNDRVNFFTQYQHLISKSWYELDSLPMLGEPPNILLIVGISPTFLLSMFGLGALLEKFDLRVGYLLNEFDPRYFPPRSLKYLDHLFTMSAELADELQNRHNIVASFLPLGVDTSLFGGDCRDRFIDIISYGRTLHPIHAQLQSYYNNPESGSDRFYFHSTFVHPNVSSLKEHTTLLARLLTSTKISLCFEPNHGEQFRGYSPISYSWFEGWAAGCAIVGTTPFGKGIEPLLNWQDSTIKIPKHPNDWVPFLEDLLDNEARLAEIAQRNYRECRLRHDWRYRLQELFTTLNLPIPEPLIAEIDQLQNSVVLHSVL